MAAAARDWWPHEAGDHRDDAPLHRRAPSRYTLPLDLATGPHAEWQPARLPHSESDGSVRIHRERFLFFRSVLACLVAAAQCLGDAFAANSRVLHGVSCPPLILYRLLIVKVEGRCSRPRAPASRSPGRLPNLACLFMTACSLVGPVPAELGELRKLSLLGMPRIPPVPSTHYVLVPSVESRGIARHTRSRAPHGWLLAVLRLQRLRRDATGLSSNSLDGAIPAELGHLTKLIELNLSGNRPAGAHAAPTARTPAKPTEAATCDASQTQSPAVVLTRGSATYAALMCYATAVGVSLRTRQATDARSRAD